LESWFYQWLNFFFHEKVSVKSKTGTAEWKKVCALLQPIKRAKYPAISEEEEAISIPLQVLAQAIFDAILVHIMNTCAASAPSGAPSWHSIKMQICEALVLNKQANVIGVLADHKAYFGADVIFMQEVAGAFVEAFQAHEQLSKRFLVLAPRSIDHVRDQNSIILVAKARLPPDMDPASCVELDLGGSLSKDVPVADGDVCAFRVPLLFSEGIGSAQPEELVLASFHGDTAGLASTPVVSAVQEAAAKAGRPLIMGLDANTHASIDPKGATKHIVSFLFDLETGDKPLRHCWAGEDHSRWNTTFNARTYLQPQLNKAVRYDERHTSKLTDCNPKDFVVFLASAFELMTPAAKDNTGKGNFIEGMDFPSLAFPSDHAIVSCTVRLLRSAS